MRLLSYLTENQYFYAKSDGYIAVDAGGMQSV